MVAQHRFPHAVEVIENVFIPMPDRCRLAARVWLPKGARTKPVPAILEYIPYRKRDHYREADELTHPYFAGHGYACLRVDLRGAGDSDGLLLDEYLEQEQQDALHLLAWIAGQDWCDGNIGMMGLSWGGFNALQVAMRRPPQLKAIVTIGSSDDRFGDDVHYMGGCMLTRNLGWAAYMLAFGSQAPDPEVVGDRWRDQWLARLENGASWFRPWFTHQRRDSYWRHGSVSEDYDAITCPVYAVGGWPDAYTNTVMRLMANLKAPCKGLIGPWGHNYPHVARPGPAIGWLQETLRWWDHWLKGRDNGIMEEPRLKVWMQESARPAVDADERDGFWAGEAAWPSPRIRPAAFRVGAGRLHRTDVELAFATGEQVRVASPESIGLASGAWCSYGRAFDLPPDQRDDDGCSYCVDTEPLTGPLACLGTPTVRLRLTSDRPLGLIAVRLNDVWPDGASARVSYGLLNLAHRVSDTNPSPMVAGKGYEITVRLNDIGHVFAKGHRVRIAISNAYWPTVWPSPESATLTVATETVLLTLPERPARDDDAKIAFEPAESSSPSPIERIRPRETELSVERDLTTDTWRMTRRGAVSTHLVDIDTTELVESEEHMTIRRGDPLSASHDIAWSMGLSRGAWRPRITLTMAMTSTKDRIAIEARLSAFEDAALVFSRDWSEAFMRDHL